MMSSPVPVVAVEGASVRIRVVHKASISMPDVDVSKRSVDLMRFQGLNASASRELVRRRRSVGWSVDDLAANDNWDINYRTPAPPDTVLSGIDGEQIDYDVIDMREDQFNKKSTWQRMKYILLLPAGLVIIGLMYACFNSICGGKCLFCQACGRNIMNQYVQGNRVHEDGHVSYYQLTEEEMDQNIELGEAALEAYIALTTGNEG